jgi:hypothetical protein
MTDPTILTMIQMFQAHPSVTQRTAWIAPKSTRPRALFPGHRARTMTRQIRSCTRMDGGVWDQLQTAVYTVSNVPELAAVVGIATDGTALWLDDQMQDEDFSTFVRTEHLAAWIPERVEDLITLLIATKCAYLMLPRLVMSSEDIPYGTPHRQAMLSSEERAEDAARRRAVAPLVHPPRWMHHYDGAFQIDACVWTPIVGRLFAISWVLNATGLISYTGVQLSQQVGAWRIFR